ncbi:MAG: cyclic nucleotide-binding domain-containing protein [Actinomycetota bacterium]
MSTYVFDNSWEKERARLAGLEALYDPGTVRLLESVGVGAGWHCLEIAGGGGSITEWLCDRVGSTGKVVATDTDTRFLEILQKPNLDVRRHNLVSDELPEEEFDLIHGRLIVQHLPDREQIIKRLVVALKPGGWLVLEDADWTPTTGALLTTIPEDDRDAVLRVWQGVTEIMREAGADETYGRRLPGELMKQGLVDVGADARNELIWGGSPAAAGSIGTLERLYESLARRGLSEADLDAELARLSDPDKARISQAQMVAAWGRRPQSGGPMSGEKHSMPPRTETVRSWLRASPLFAHVSEVEMSRIGSLADELHVDPGEELTVEGQPGNTFFVIAKGTATVSRAGTRLVGLGPGSYFGEIALLEQGPRTATVTADSRMWLFVFDAASFASLMNGIPAVSDEIFRALAERKRNVER